MTKLETGFARAFSNQTDAETLDALNTPPKLRTDRQLRITARYHSSLVNDDCGPGIESDLRRLHSAQ